MTKDISHLTPKQIAVTQHGETEAPFNNEYYNEKREGVYVDVVTGEPLFSSEDKYDSGSGWPAFTKPIKEDLLVEKEDTSYGMRRVEVKGKNSDSHLGHVFNDGPKEKGGMNYCINSAALKFIPNEETDK